MKIFDDAYQHKLIYIFKIDDAAHNGLLKIGDTTIKNIPPTKKNLEDAANDRIRKYTTTAAIKYKLLHVELAVTDDGNLFRDYAVHRVLKKYRRQIKGTTGREWFKVDLDTAINAIRTVKRGRKKFTPEKFSKDDFRPEQLDAINLTVKHFKKNGKDFLWNAKMRFGKTLCALQVVKLMDFKKTIIITHRPVVNVGWYDDFNKIFGDTDYIFLGRDDDIDGRKNFVYFISMQDLRGSEIVGGNFDKNEKIFATDWDFVIVDEAHEGTTTALGDAVIKNIVKDNSKFLALSGTPFNILDDYDDNVYTWDYLMEQRAKDAWDKNNFSETNPYADLPKMNIFTYDLGKIFNYVDDDKVFSFREFFKTDGKNFVHEPHIKNFLDRMTTADNYPFARADYRELFKHTLWIIPGVKEGKALSELLKRHKVFKDFKIVNVAGNGDSDDEPLDALEKVRDAIDNHDKTITLSCGKLTAGVTVPEWTAVFMLAGSYSTSAANYLQTIFRVQSPCVFGDKVKQNCFVFDFAPDRTLKMIAASVAVSARAGKTHDTDRQNLQDLLKFCPVIALEGSRMEFTADNLLQQLKTVYVERTVRNGFADNSLYNDELLKLDELALDEFNNLKKIVGSSDAQKVFGDITVNDQGLKGKTRKKISKKDRSPEQQEIDRRKRQRSNAIKILRAVSIRMPLLIYGADVPFDADIKIENFAELIDDASWTEFMPNGVTKKFFANFIKYYDKDIFIAAGRKIRLLAKDADELKPSERVNKIAELFATFKNPDKETVLTPWRVVNLHIDSVFDDNFFSADKKILEINSKTGLYPLLIAQKIYRARLKGFDEDDFNRDALLRFWDNAVADNIFVICKTPMAQKITRRTLIGFRQASVNAKHFDDLINILKTTPDIFINQVSDFNFWDKGVGKMFFDAVVGNPPYQNVTANTSDEPVYNYFVETAFKLSDKVSLIHPARCLFNAGKTPKDFNQRLLNNEHIKIVKYFPKSQEIFPTSDIKGGVAITYYDANRNFGAIGTFIPFDELQSIYQKVCVDNKNFSSFSKIIYPPEIYHFTKKFHEDNPNAAQILSDGHANDLTTNTFDKLPKIFLNAKPDDGYEYIQIYGLSKMKRSFKWIRRDYVNAPAPLTKWKVLVPKSNGSGALGEVLSTPLVGSPLVGSPLVGSTQTFITVGAFDTRAEAEACIAYIRSKFCRVMLGILKVTQHNPPATWSKVPLEDFTADSDIKWREPVDEQLYRKYGLSDAEIKFIETHVRAMT
ncbi:MAG: Eco57I restriction-modification methylase domain-containing protein [Selenomonadaceae bacterium]|nr:Eco57I restriction-modification methylase domain-containing protein [Selenomonadaceae bacterium]